MQKNEEKEKSIEELLLFQMNKDKEKLNKVEDVFSKKMGTPLEIILKQRILGDFTEIL